MVGHKAVRTALSRIAWAVVCLAALSSCAPAPRTRAAVPAGAGQVYVYVACADDGGPRVDVSLSDILLEDEDGVRHPLGVGAELSSSAPRPSRVCVCAAEPRRYVAMVWRVAGVVVREGGEARSLEPPEGGEVSAPLDATLEPGQSLTLFASWSPDRAAAGGAACAPVLSARGQGADLTGSLAFVTNTDDDSLTVINRTLGEVVGSVAVGRAPMGIVAAPDGSRLYVANHGDRSISVVDPVAGRVVETIGNLGRAPSELALSRDGSLLLALNTEADSVTALDTATHAPLRTIDVGRRPGGLVFDHERNLAYVADTGAGTLTVVDGNALRAVRTISMGQAPRALAVAGGELFVADEAACSLLTASAPGFGSAVAVPFSVAPGALLAGGGGMLFLSSPRPGALAFIRTASRAVAKVLPLAPGAGRMAQDALHRRLYVVCSGADELAVVDTSLRGALAPLQVGRNPYGVAIIDE